MRQVDPDIVDAARGMGMTRARDRARASSCRSRLPVIFAGIRTAAVQVVSGAVLAAYIGGGGLGDFITAGIAMMALPQLLVGAIPATLLSIGTDSAVRLRCRSRSRRAGCARRMIELARADQAVPRRAARPRSIA